jgi:flagellar biosynthesis/type III secretory pathway chaperone
MTLAEELHTLLQEEIKILKELVEYGNNQRDALVSYNIEQLEEITRKQQKLSSDLRTLEQMRIRFIASMLSLSAREAQVMTLSEVQTKLPQEQAKLFDMTKIQIAALFSKLRGINSINRYLLNRASNSIQDLISVIKCGGDFKDPSMCNVTV